MKYSNPQVAEAAEKLKQKLGELEVKRDILKSPELRDLYSQIPTLPEDQRSIFGQEVNQLKNELQSLIEQEQNNIEVKEIDITAPFDINSEFDKRPKLLSADQGSTHPITKELSKILDIFYRMGFNVEESRQLDDDYHMFEALNFPPNHPARDDYDTFSTTEGLLAPAHTSTMQHRILKKYHNNLNEGKSIAAVIPGRVFRNEDLDARHEHTFYQLEGIYVAEGVNTGNLIATLKTFLEAYYQQELDIKMQPFYFPFTEPSFEFAMSCPFCNKQGCNVCSYTGWIELLGCGLIHPNVLKMAGIDTNKYTGFAWGGGIERLIMMKYGIDDIRLFESGKLDFLEQFK